MQANGVCAGDVTNDLELESRPDLNATNWFPVTNPPVVIEGHNTVLVPLVPADFWLIVPWHPCAELYRQ
jgi:hypothetical protein